MLIEIFAYLKIRINGDWGLGIGDWAQSPSPIPIFKFIIFLELKYIIKNILLLL